VVFYFIKKKTFIYDDNYLIFLPVLTSAWGLGGLLSGKFRIKSHHSLTEMLKKQHTSLLISLGAIALFLTEAQFSISRFVVVGSFIAAFLVEVAIDLKRSRMNGNVLSSDKIPLSYTYLFLDLLILTWILFFYYSKRSGLVRFDENQVILLFGIYISWIFAAMITHQFKQAASHVNFWKPVALHLKFIILILALISFIVYILHIDQYFKESFFFGIILYSFWSIVIAVFQFLDKVPRRIDYIKSDFIYAYEPNIPESKRTPALTQTYYKFPGSYGTNSSLGKKLRLVFLKEHPQVYTFLNRSLDIDTFDPDKSHVIRTGDLYNIKVMPDEQIELFINLHKLNDLDLINEYLIEVNNKLADGGIIVGNFEPIKYRYKRFLKKYPFLFANILYLFDFIWHRAIPKLPVIQKIFFAFSKGKNRALSLAEVLGRIYYCGFEVLDLKIAVDLYYFIAKKISYPSSDKNPSYSLFIKMRRLGKNGVPIYVYKLRTMHPYSEYLQDLVYKNNSLDFGGKFRNDFRITRWGVIFRRLWLDELPMLINWLKGECKLVGVRPLTTQFLSLYDRAFRDRRLKYKPGLVPPFYADLPKTMDEIIESEKKYLDAYDKNGFRTDLIYFGKALKNIVFNKQRSA
jgi:lipopolysaccharide/colanic/teichoic acid biosynthesis glycosyltransferase